jgi:hypothetical protein
MTTTSKRRVIHLNPHRVRDDTLEALEREIESQYDGELGDVLTIPTIVLDTTEGDNGLDSHATVITTTDNDHNHDNDNHE